MAVFAGLGAFAGVDLAPIVFLIQYPFLSYSAHENFPTNTVGPFFAAVEPMCAMAYVYWWKCLGAYQDRLLACNTINRPQLSKILWT